MTLSTSSTLGGFLQGMQANAMALTGTLVFLLVVFLIIRSFIARFVDQGEADSMRRGINWAAGVIAIVAVVGFGINGANYATNAIPRTDLDKSSVYDQMNSNIQKR